MKRLTALSVGFALATLVPGPATAHAFEEPADSISSLEGPSHGLMRRLLLEESEDLATVEFLATWDGQVFEYVYVADSQQRLVDASISLNGATVFEVYGDPSHGAQWATSPVEEVRGRELALVVRSLNVLERDLAALGVHRVDLSLDFPQPPTAANPAWWVKALEIIASACLGAIAGVLLDECTDEEPGGVSVDNCCLECPDKSIVCTKPSGAVCTGGDYEVLKIACGA